MKNTIADVGKQRFEGTLILPSNFTVNEWADKFEELGIEIKGTFYAYGGWEE